MLNCSFSFSSSPSPLSPLFSSFPFQQTVLRRNKMKNTRCHQKQSKTKVQKESNTDKKSSKFSSKEKSSLFLFQFFSFLNNAVLWSDVLFALNCIVLYCVYLTADFLLRVLCVCLVCVECVVYLFCTCFRYLFTMF